MEINQFLILQFIAHILTDFIFQNKNSIRQKDLSGFKSKFLILHAAIAFLFSWVLSFQINFIIGALMIGITHYLIDGFKKNLKNHSKLGKYSFFIDQALHLIIIVIVVQLFDRYYGIEPQFDLPDVKQTFLILGFLICLKPANILIKEILKAFEISYSNGNDLPNAGKLIGILERLLVLTFILFNQFESVGFLIAAKSILRYKNDDTIKTEYVLIGTMLSFGIALVIGILFNLNWDS